MTDQYYETSQAGTAEADTSREPAHDAASSQQYETTEPADHGYGEYTETDAEVQARIAGQDELPAPEESRHATWGDNPDYHDETDLAFEYDGALAPEGHARDPDKGDQDQAGVADAAPAAERINDPPAEAPDNSTDASAEQVEHSPADTGERISELETENAQLGKNLTDLQARLERLEHASQAEPSTGITSQERGTAQQDTARAPKEGSWHIPSDEGLALGAAAAGGVITTVSDYLPYLHADAAGITASALAVGAAAVTYMRARREARHARRTKD